MGIVLYVVTDMKHGRLGLHVCDDIKTRAQIRTHVQNPLLYTSLLIVLHIDDLLAAHGTDALLVCTTCYRRVLV